METLAEPENRPAAMNFAPSALFICIKIETSYIIVILSIYILYNIIIIYYNIKKILHLNIREKKK